VIRLAQILLTFITLLACPASYGQTKADSLAGQWKYMGAMESQALKSDPSWYKRSNPTPKFESVEFTKKGGCTWKERDKKPVTAIYSISANELTFGGITYTIKSIDGKNLTLTRSYYIFRNTGGKDVRVDEEQISFEKIK
jgi:hypothetical protein